MRWDDRVYGERRDRGAGDPGPDRLSDLPAAQGRPPGRALGAGVPVQERDPFEHSLGVYLLLRRLGADRREQVAGLLHDISHTAFSHAVDFLISSGSRTITSSSSR